ncbi:beta-N-acetylhexosaminidase [Halobacteriovorax sp. HLS]|uniref:beta-N-acetylhexosaminidase n=1 Tax=Halobacteriovorax sp. HLS TaxID=2234000 RepID=UPI000FD728F1|nr:beta-N-acetylhexosaminidase [Halobacteriovorax sp. HLS]
MSNLGQLIITGISGTSLTDEERDFLEKENIGGVILFSNNYESPAQLAELVNQIQTTRREYPLFVCVDNEGGRVFRFKTGFTTFPPMLDIGLLDSPKTVFECAQIMAKELKSCGVNVNLAPVCDIYNNELNKVIGDRAFGKDAETVSKYISSIIRGLQTSDILSCAKHFPGHGNTTKDSHFDLPIVKKTIEDLRAEEFIPFVKAVKARVEFVMMAHLIVDSIDEELPTSLSPKAYQLLREELRYNKLIITDDMQMKAIDDRYSVEDAAVMAINAGADIVEYKDMSYARRALDGLKKAQLNQTLKVEVITDRYSRVMDCKERLLKDYTPVYIPDIGKNIATINSQNYMDEVRKKIEEL